MARLGFFDKLSISSGIELELGPSRFKDFFITKKKTLFDDFNFQNISLDLL
jgi:hypothetical protein